MSTKENIPARPVLQGEDTKSLTLREFEQRYNDLQMYIAKSFDLIEIKIRSERELSNTITFRLEKALELQATEIARRLSELNHAHELAAENWARSLPRELFEQYKEEASKWRTVVENSMAERKGFGLQISNLDSRLKILENGANRVVGMFILLGLMGIMGCISFGLGLLRLAGLIR